MTIKEADSRKRALKCTLHGYFYSHLHSKKDNQQHRGGRGLRHIDKMISSALIKRADTQADWQTKNDSLVLLACSQYLPHLANKLTQLHLHESLLKLL